MISKRKLISYFNKRRSSIYKNSRALQAKMESERLHDLRLDLKKLKALNDLLISTGRVRGLTYSRPLKNFFKHIGRLRTAEINLNMFREFQYSHAGIEKDLHYLMQNEYEILCDSREELTNELRKLKRKLRHSIDEVKNREAAAYCNNTLQELNRFYTTSPDTDQLHQSRKKIKNLIYIRKLLSQEMSKSMYMNDEYLGKLQEDIGRWHDITIAMQLLADNKLCNELVFCMPEEEKLSILASIRKTTASFFRSATENPNRQLPVVNEAPSIKTSVL